MSPRRSPRVNDLGHDPIPLLLVRMALPSITAQVVLMLYNIVDRIYIGHIDQVGSLALTGVGVCFPLICLVNALTMLIGTGGGARAAIAMGEGRNDYATRILGNCAVLAVLISICVTLVLFFACRPALLAFGATENTLGFAVDYFAIYVWGTLFTLTGMSLNQFITTQGFALYSMGTVLLGAGLNVVLDPIFIFVLNMGVKGAAIATVLSQAASAIWVVLFLTGRRTKLRLTFKCLGLQREILGRVLSLGISPFTMQATESLLFICLNSSLKGYGGDVAVGAATICTSAMMFITAPISGLCQGFQPFLGFNYGACNTQRVKRGFLLMLLAAVCISTFTWGVIQLFPQFFVGLFNDNPALVEVAVWALRIYAAGAFMLGAQFSCQQSFVAFGQAKVSMLLALLRKVILLIPLIYIFPLFFTDKVFAVFLAEPVADVTAALSTATVFALRVPKLLEARAHHLPPDPPKP